MRDTGARGAVHRSLRTRRSRVPAVVSLLALVLLAPGATSTVAGCAGDGGAGGRACTEIGCNDGVTFVVARGAIDHLERGVAKACLDGRCRRHRLDADVFGRPGGIALDAWFPAETLDPAASHTASLTIRDGPRTIFALERRVELEGSRPNGPGCPPTCHNATIRVTAADVRAFAAR